MPRATLWHGRGRSMPMLGIQNLSQFYLWWPPNPSLPPTSHVMNSSKSISLLIFHVLFTFLPLSLPVTTSQAFHVGYNAFIVYCFCFFSFPEEPSLFLFSCLDPSCSLPGNILFLSLDVQVPLHDLFISCMHLHLPYRMYQFLNC